MKSAGRDFGVRSAATTLEANAALDRAAGQRGELRGLPDRAGAAVRHRDADPRGTFEAGSDAQEERLERGVDEPDGSGCADHENEGWSDSPGARILRDLPTYSLAKEPGRATGCEDKESGLPYK